MSDPTFDVVVLGDARPDLILRGPGVDVAFDDVARSADDAALSLGGSGAIIASGLARLGMRTAFVGKVGDDHLGAFVRDALGARDVATSGVVVSPDRPSGVRVILASKGPRAIVEAMGTSGDLRAELIDADLLASARHVHVASYFRQTALHDDLPDLLQAVRDRGGTTSIDPDVDPADRWDGGLLGLLDRVDLLMLDSSEVRRITGIDDIDVAAESLAERGTTLAVKFGQGGGMVLRGEDTFHVEAVAVGVVDRTGAGDSFDAGFLAAVLSGWPLDRALRLAVTCGSFSVRTVGGVQGQPTMAEAIAALEGS